MDKYRNIILNLGILSSAFWIILVIPMLTSYFLKFPGYFDDVAQFGYNNLSVIWGYISVTPFIYYVYIGYKIVIKPISIYMSYIIITIFFTIVICEFFKEMPIVNQIRDVISLVFWISMLIHGILPFFLKNSFKVGLMLYGAARLLILGSTLYIALMVASFKYQIPVIYIISATLPLSDIIFYWKARQHINKLENKMHLDLID